jgi:hypothetical protein
MSLPRVRYFAVLLASGLVLSSSVIAWAEDPFAGESASKPAPPKPAIPGDASKSAQTSPFAVRPAKSSADARISAALETPTVLEFLETPLQDVISYLADYHKIDIQLDKKALDDVGIGTDTPITRTLRGISLRSALQLMLKEFDLTYVIDNEVLQITTLRQDISRTELAVYNVGGLIKDGSVEELAEVIQKSILPPKAPADHASVGLFTVTPYRQLLIVRHSQQGHREVEELLQQLHKAMQPGCPRRASWAPLRSRVGNRRPKPQRINLDAYPLPAEAQQVRVAHVVDQDHDDIGPPRGVGGSCRLADKE